MKISNETPAQIFRNMLLAASGLFSFGFGVYLTIQANIGVAPWDTLMLGVSQVTDISYGNISVMMSVVIICIDLMMKERIGLGTILDAIIVGKTVDLFNWLNLVPLLENTAAGIAVMLVAELIMGFAVYVYMRAGLCCGPRDSLTMGIGRRLKKVPIGWVNNMILVVVLFFGWRLGGPIGIGTLIAAVASGIMVQLAFNVMKFEPKDVIHQGFFESIKVLTGKGSREE